MIHNNFLLKSKNSKFFDLFINDLFSTNSLIDITDWVCALGESLNIAIALRSTTAELRGVVITLSDA